MPMFAESELQLCRLLGEGSFSSVYKATHKASGAIIAVQVVASNTSTNYYNSKKNQKEIQKEIDILRKCSSPYIVGCFDCFTNNSPTQQQFEIRIAMEYCEGGSMGDWIENCGVTSFPEDFIRAVCASVVLGLEYLHTVLNVCHNGIKCRNVLLTKNGHAKLAVSATEFTTNTMNKHATVLNHNRKRDYTTNVARLSSPYWTAPEILSLQEEEEPLFSSKKHDGRVADIWSLGILAIEMAEGSPPHSYLHPQRAVDLILNESPPTLSDSENWSPEMTDFLYCCCRKDPKQRKGLKALTSHPFIKQEVLQLQSLHKTGRASSSSSSSSSSSLTVKNDDTATDPYASNCLQITAEQLEVGTTSSAETTTIVKQGLPAIRLVMQMMKKKCKLPNKNRMKTKNRS